MVCKRKKRKFAFGETSRGGFVCLESLPQRRNNLGHKEFEKALFRSMVSMTGFTIVNASGVQVILRANVEISPSCVRFMAPLIFCSLVMPRRIAHNSFLMPMSERRRTRVLDSPRIRESSSSRESEFTRSSDCSVST